MYFIEIQFLLTTTHTIMSHCVEVYHCLLFTRVAESQNSQVIVTCYIAPLLEYCSSVWKTATIIAGTSRLCENSCDELKLPRLDACSCRKFIMTVSELWRHLLQTMCTVSCGLTSQSHDQRTSSSVRCDTQLDVTGCKLSI